MTLVEWLVTIGGLVVMAWIVWYFWLYEEKEA